LVEWENVNEEGGIEGEDGKDNELDKGNKTL
jgi:hypothetical protein